MQNSRYNNIPIGQLSGVIAAVYYNYNFLITCLQAERSPGDRGSQLIISSVCRSSLSSSGQYLICS